MVLDSDVGVYRGSTNAGMIDGTLYVRTNSGAPGYRLVSVSEVFSGRLVGAIKQGGALGACFPFAAPHVPSLVGVAGPDGMLLVGTVSVSDGGISWSPTLRGLPIGEPLFRNDQGWGLAFVDGGIDLLAPPTANNLQSITEDYTEHAVGIGDHLVWSTYVPGYAGEVLKGYTASGGVQIVVAQADFHDHVMALSDTKLAWVGVTGPERASGIYESAQFFWAPWPAPIGPATIHAGPRVVGASGAPVVHGLLDIATWGDFVAATGCAVADREDTCDLYVSQLSTGKLWRIPHRPGAELADVMAVSEQEVLMGEVDSPDLGGGQLLQRLLRFDLSQLDVLAQEW